MSGQPQNTSGTPATPQHEPQSVDAGELIDNLSRRISGLPQRAALTALTELALHHPELAETCWRHLEHLAVSNSVTERALALGLATVLAHAAPQSAITLAITAPWSLVMDRRDGRERVRTTARALGRHVGLLIPLEQRERAAEVDQLVLARVERVPAGEGRTHDRHGLA